MRIFIYFMSALFAILVGQNSNAGQTLVVSIKLDNGININVIDPAFGDVIVGQTVVLSGRQNGTEIFATCGPCSVNSVNIGQLSIVPRPGFIADDFEILDDHCSGTTIFVNVPGCTFAVSFSPKQEGTQLGWIEFSALGHTGQIPISGTGIADPNADEPPVDDTIHIGPDGSISNSNGNSISNKGTPHNSDSCSQASAGQPVNLASGAMWHELTDFSIQGRTEATALSLKRTYQSMPLSTSEATSGDFGPHWVHNWETKLLSASSGMNPDIIWVNPVGGAYYFKRNPDLSFQSPNGCFSKLSVFPDHYLLKSKYGIEYNFSRKGKLLQMSEPHGESILLSYDSNQKLNSISTGLAGSVSFLRNPAGHIVQAKRQRDGLNYSFNYDSQGRLASSSDFDGNTTNYSYATIGTDNSILSQITDPLSRSISFQYDSQFRSVAQTEYGGGHWAFSYSLDSEGRKQTQVQGLDGQITTYHFDSSFLLVQTDLPGGAVTTQTWNLNKQIASKTDELGKTTFFQYDSHGNMTAIQNPEDLIPKTLIYDQNFDVPTQINPLAGASTQFQISQKGDIQQISRDIFSLNLTHDNYGNRLSINNGRASYSDQTNLNGQKTLAFDARNPETRTYDDRGRVTTRSFQSGKMLSYAFDDFDRVLSIQDSSGPTTYLTYDLVGRVLSKTLSDGIKNQITHYQWDERDRLVKVIDPLGNQTQFLYDIVNFDQIKKITNQPVAIIDALGRQTKYQYDNRQRLIRETDAKGGVTQYIYNNRGDLVAIIDPLNKKTQFAYDGNQRLITKWSPSVITNDSGKNIATIEVTSFVYDVAGRLLQEKKKVSATTSAAVTEYTYDNLDRVIRKVQKIVKPTGQVQIQDDSTYTYQPQLDAVRLASANNSVLKLNFNYEALPPFQNINYSTEATDPNNPLNLIQGQYSVARSSTNEISSINDQQNKILFDADYDPAGRLLKMSSGNLFTAPQNLIKRIVDDSNLTTEITYDSFGRKEKVSHSTGLSGHYAYDLINRPTEIQWTQKNTYFWQKDKSFSSEKLSYDKVGNITVADKSISQISYYYDVLNQISAVRSNKGLGHFNRNFTYDLNGNRTQDSLTGSAQFISDQIVASQGVSYRSDVNGFGQLTDGITKSQAKHYDYKIDGKLSHFERRQDFDRDDEFSDRNVLSTDYYYDALGRRVAKIFKMKNNKVGLTQSYSYLIDQDKILLGRTGKDQLTLYMDGQGIDEHLGQVNKLTSKGYAVDHLGSELNTATAGPRNSFGPFGETLPGWSKIAMLDSDPVMYGFAGRQYDLESGNYYNRARYYDPVTGRFISKDPIGFASGDTNMYRYVMNDPVNKVDPSGLFNIIVGSGSNSAVIGGGGEATSGGYYNLETGNSGGFTSSGGGSNQYGLGAMGGAFVGFVTGPTSNVGGAFENWNLAIPGTNVSATLYLNNNGSVVGGSVGYGPGIGFTRTNTNTTLYPQCH